MYDAAAYPERSPTTPPPTATTQSFLEKLLSSIFTRSVPNVSRLLEPSPDSTVHMMDSLHCSATVLA